MVIHQIGAGGVGFWVAAALVRDGVKNLTVWDSDDLQGGLGYSRLPKATLSTAKVNLLRGFCAAVMGDTQPKIHTIRFYGHEATKGDLVVDCSDMDLDRRKEVWKAVQDIGARIIRVSYDGKNHCVVVAEGLPLAGRSGGGYSETPNLALSFMAGGIGALAVQRILAGHKEHIEFQVSLSDYFGDSKPLGGVLEAGGIAEAAPKRKRKPRVKVTQAAPVSESVAEPVVAVADEIPFDMPF